MARHDASERDDVVSSVAAEWARGETSPTHRHLILGDPSTMLARALKSGARSVVRWHRRIHEGQEHGPWPPEGTFDLVWVRLPRSTLETRMLLSAAVARVGDGGRAAVFGSNDEGIRSAAKHTLAGLGPLEAVLVKRRCRVLVAGPGPEEREDEAEHRIEGTEGLESWASLVSVDWGAGSRPWVHYPGVFAHGRLDPGTKLLIASLPRLDPGARVLDFGAGSGVVGAAVLEKEAGVSVDLLDTDAVALEAAGQNVPGARLIAARDLTGVEGPYELIVSNPPIHEGKAQTLRVLGALAEGAASLMTPQGRLILVTQRRLSTRDLLESRYGQVRIVADEGPFRVWEAARPHEAPRRSPR